MADTLDDKQRTTLAVIHDLWSRASGNRWPTFTEIDKRLYKQQVDAEQALQSLCPRWAQVAGGRVPCALDSHVSLTVRGLAQLQPPPSILTSLLQAVRYLAVREQEHQPGRLTVAVTSDELTDHLHRSSGGQPRPSWEIIAYRVGQLLEQERHLWTQWRLSPGSRYWTLEVSRNVRRFRNVISIDEYVKDYVKLTDDLRADATEAPTLRVLTAARTAEQSVRSTPGETVNSVDAGTPMSPGVNRSDPRAVFVVHGRDNEAKQAIFDFLRALDLRPQEWEQLVTATGSAAPFTGDTIARAFPLVQAVVVILTPDDEARLLPELRGPGEPPHETELTGQARQNVLFEAGMAFARYPDRTVLVEIGRVRPFSDVDGRHKVKLTGDPISLHSLVNKLRTAGCPVDITGPGWLDGSRFSGLRALHRGGHSAPLADPDDSDGKPAFDSEPTGNR